MNLLDFIILVFIGACMIGGLKRGLVRQVLELVGIVVAFIVAARYGVAFGQMLSGFLNLDNLAAKVTASVLNIDLGGLVGDLVTSAVPAITGLLFNFLGYILLFFLTLAAAKLLAMLIGAVAKLPVLGTVDKVAGVALGFLKGALIALAAVWILNLLPIPWAMEAMESSIAAHYLLSIAPGLYQRIFDPEKYKEILDTIRGLQGMLP